MSRWRTVCIASGILSLYIGSSLTFESISLSPVLYAAIEGVGLLLLLVGGYLWAKIKARHWAWMFVVLVGVVGVVVLDFLRDRSSETPAEDEVPFSWDIRPQTRLGHILSKVGGILWFSACLLCLVWVDCTLMEAEGWWMVFFVVQAAPVAWICAVFIVRAFTGAFPWILLCIWIASLVGVVLLYVGWRLRGNTHE